MIFLSFSTVFKNTKTKTYRVSIPQSAVKNLAPIARRLYRLFSHTFYNHREIFFEFEVPILFLFILS